MRRDALGDSEQKDRRSGGIWAAVNRAGWEGERGEGGGEGSDLYGVVYRCVDILNRGTFSGNNVL